MVNGVCAHVHVSVECACESGWVPFLSLGVCVESEWVSEEWWMVWESDVKMVVKRITHSSSLRISHPISLSLYDLSVSFWLSGCLSLLWRFLHPYMSRFSLCLHLCILECVGISRSIAFLYPSVCGERDSFVGRKRRLKQRSGMKIHVQIIVISFIPGILPSIRLSYCAFWFFVGTIVVFPPTFHVWT